MQIKHINQTGNGCVLACIAMACEVDYFDLVKKYPECEKNGTSYTRTISIIATLGIQYIMYANPIIPNNRVVMITVPSLNIKGGNHCIVISTMNDEFNVHDPANGKDKKRYETIHDVRSFTEVIEILWD